MFAFVYSSDSDKYFWGYPFTFNEKSYFI